MFKKLVALSLNDEAQRLFSQRSEAAQKNIIDTMRLRLPITESQIAKPELATKAEKLPEMNWHGVNFKAIPAAVNALLGSSSESANPVHQVNLRAFYIMETPVTQTQYTEVTGSNPSKFEGKNNPVEQVSWFDAVNYAKALSLQSEDIANDVKAAIGNLSAEKYMEYALEHPEAGLFRLATESEWEYAARGKEGGSSKNYPWGNNIEEIDSYAQTSRNNRLNSTKPVGLLQANGFGLKDMIGNVWEWTADWYKDSTFNHEVASNPKGPEDGNYRVLRGGSWWHSGDGPLQSACRGINEPGRRGNDIGIRLVRIIQ